MVPYVCAHGCHIVGGTNFFCSIFKHNSNTLLLSPLPLVEGHGEDARPNPPVSDMGDHALATSDSSKKLVLGGVMALSCIMF